MSKLRISVVTPSLNQGPFIERTITSVLGQTGEFDLEYFVVDGGSTDETLDILRRYQDRLRWISEPDRGQADAVNKGFRQATGDIIGWLNSDDVLEPGALAEVAKVFATRPEVQWVHGQCAIIDEQDRVIRRWISAYKNWCCRRYSYRRLLTENFISQMTVFWRRPLLEQVGYLDDSLYHVFDYDLWLRLGKAADPVFIPRPLARFRWYHSSKSGSGFVAQLAEADAVAQRHGGDRLLQMCLRSCKTTAVRAVYKGLSLCRQRAGRANAALR